MKVFLPIGVIFILLLIFCWPGISQIKALYVVDVTQQVIVTRFGEVQSVKTSPGLYFKVPFLDAVSTYDRRVLGQRINASLRAEVAARNREQIIGGDVELDDQGNPLTDEEGNTQVFATESRTEMLDKVLSAIRAALAQEREPFGIEMLDVRIKRADFPTEVSGRVFERMRSERERIARSRRAEGEEEARRTRARADRDVEIILAEADQEANGLRGEGEAEAIRILAEALNKDPEFFAFQRSLEAYRSFLNTQTTIILSTEADIFKFLQGPGDAPTGGN